MFWFYNQDKSKTAEMSRTPEDRAGDPLQNQKYYESPKFVRNFLFGAKI